MHVRLFALLALGAMPLAASAQTAVDALRFADRNPAFGVRSAGLGGAVAAGWADPSALIANPAGLGFYSRSELSGALSHLDVRSDATYRIGTTSTADRQRARADALDGLAFVGKARTVQGSLVFGASYQQTNTFDRTRGLGTETDQTSVTFGLVDRALTDFRVQNGNLTFGDNLARIGYEAGLIDYVPGDSSNTFSYPFYTAVLPNTTVQQLARIDEEGGMHELNLGGAFEASPGLMVGASVGLAFGRYRYAQRFEETDVNDQNRAADFSLTLDGVTYAGFDRAVIRDRYEDDLAGVTGRLGVAYQAPGSLLRVGGRLETPTFYTVQEDFSTTVETTFDNGRTLSYGGRSGDTGTGSFEYTLQTPWRLALGLATDVGPLRLSGDVEYVDWSAMRLRTSEVPGYFDDANLDIEENLEPTVTPRVGAELGVGSLVLRAGYSHQADPRNDQTFLGVASDRSRAHYTGGLTYRFTPRAAFDVALTYTEYGDEFQPYVDTVARPYLTDQAERVRVSVGLRVSL